MRNYKRQTNRASTPNNVMERAPDDIYGGAFVRATANKYNIDRMTLKKHYFAKRGTVKTTGYKGLSESKVIIPPLMEQHMANHIKNFSHIFQQETGTGALNIHQLWKRTILIPSYSTYCRNGTTVIKRK